jgi:hypothetical protein
MASKVRTTSRKAASSRTDFDELYLDLITRFYEEEDLERARKAAGLIEKFLDGSPSVAGSIRGEEVRSLIAELRGNLSEAIQSREAEIRKILELHTLAANTANWKTVSKQYDFGDVSDRLDLLAGLYDSLGQKERAIAVLLESKAYCTAHGIPFDSEDMLLELGQALRGSSQKRVLRGKN